MENKIADTIAFLVKQLNYFDTLCDYCEFTQDEITLISDMRDGCTDTIEMLEDYSHYDPAPCAECKYKDDYLDHCINCTRRGNLVDYFEKQVDRVSNTCYNNNCNKQTVFESEECL